MDAPFDFPFRPGEAPSQERIRAWLAATAAAAYGPARAAELAPSLDAAAAKLDRLVRLGRPPLEREPDFNR